MAEDAPSGSFDFAPFSYVGDTCSRRFAQDDSLKELEVVRREKKMEPCQQFRENTLVSAWWRTHLRDLSTSRRSAKLGTSFRGAPLKMTDFQSGDDWPLFPHITLQHMTLTPHN